jgi:hypothetical protein
MNSVPVEVCGGTDVPFRELLSTSAQSWSHGAVVSTVKSIYLPSLGDVYGFLMGFVHIWPGLLRKHGDLDKKVYISCTD